MTEHLFDRSRNSMEGSSRLISEQYRDSVSTSLYELHKSSTPSAAVVSFERTRQPSPAFEMWEGNQQSENYESPIIPNSETPTSGQVCR